MIVSDKFRGQSPWEIVFFLSTYPSEQGIVGIKSNPLKTFFSKKGDPREHE